MQQRRQQPRGAASWWQVYAPVDAGKDEFPHIGQVIRYYRKLKGWTAERLAAQLGITRSRVYKLEETVSMPTSLTRRQLLVQLLGIPPVLLNLPQAADALARLALERAPGLSPQVSTLYEEVLTLSWALYYTASTQTSTPMIARHLAMITEDSAAAAGLARDQLLAFECRFRQLSAVAARDRLAFDQALADSQRAVELAQYLGNAELLAAARFRRARIFLDRQRPDLAMAELEKALPAAQQSRDPLRCYVLICTAETISRATPHDPARQQQAFALLDQVGRTVRAQGVLDGDGSFTRVDLAGYLMERANVERRFGHPQQALDTLAIVREQLSPELTRWHANLGLAEAYASLAAGDVEGSAICAQEALRVAHAIHSPSAEAKVTTLARRLEQQQPRQSAVRDLVARLRSQQAG